MVCLLRYVTVVWAVCVCVSSVTLVHPAKAVTWNKMPFGRDTRVVLSNIVLDRDPSYSTGRGDLGVRNPQFIAMMPIAKLLWPLLLLSHS